MHNFSNRSENEKVALAFIFTDTLSEGDTIASVVSMRADVWNGSDPYVQGILSGAPAINPAGNTVSQYVEAGVRDVDYLITCKVQTAGGETLELAGVQRVRRST